jgi:hypothetical protein
MNTPKVTAQYVLQHGHTVQRTERDDNAMRLKCSCGWASKWHAHYGSLGAAMQRHSDQADRS